METQNDSGLYVIEPAADPDDDKTEAPANSEQTTPPEAAVDPEAVNAVTAFVALLMPDGHWYAHVNIESLRLTVQRPATRWDMVAGCPAIVSEVEASMTAEAVMAGQIQLSNQIAQQRQAAAIQQALAEGKNAFEAAKAAGKPF